MHPETDGAGGRVQRVEREPHDELRDEVREAVREALREAEWLALARDWCRAVLKRGLGVAMKDAQSESSTLARQLATGNYFKAILRMVFAVPRDSDGGSNIQQWQELRNADALYLTEAFVWAWVQARHGKSKWEICNAAGWTEHPDLERAIARRLKLAREFPEYAQREEHHVKMLQDALEQASGKTGPKIKPHYVVIDAVGAALPSVDPENCADLVRGLLSDLGMTVPSRVEAAYRIKTSRATHSVPN